MASLIAVAKAWDSMYHKHKCALYHTMWKIKTVALLLQALAVICHDRPSIFMKMMAKVRIHTPPIETLADYQSVLTCVRQCKENNKRNAVSFKTHNGQQCELLEYIACKGYADLVPNDSYITYMLSALKVVNSSQSCHGVNTTTRVFTNSA